MRTIEVTLDGKNYTVEVRPDPEDRSRYVATVDGAALPVYVPPTPKPGTLEWMVVDNRPYELILDDGLEWLISSGGMHRLAVRWLDVMQARPTTNDGRVKAPIPGLITRLLVEPGAAVEAGEPLLVLEAMKMENDIRAPRTGTVQAVGVKVGQSVVLGELMVEIG